MFPEEGHFPRVPMVDLKPLPLVLIFKLLSLPPFLGAATSPCSHLLYWIPLVIAVVSWVTYPNQAVIRPWEHHHKHILGENKGRWGEETGTEDQMSDFGKSEAWCPCYWYRPSSQQCVLRSLQGFLPSGSPGSSCWFLSVALNLKSP